MGSRTGYRRSDSDRTAAPAPRIAEAEFPDAKASDDYQRYLHGEFSSMPGTMSDYYRRGLLALLWQNGATFRAKSMT